MKKTALAFIILSFTLYSSLFAQSKGANTLSLKECVDYALKNNENIKVLELTIKYQEYMKNSSYELPKTTAVYTQGQFNSIYKYDNNITVSQTIPYPGVFQNNKE